MPIHFYDPHKAPLLDHYVGGPSRCPVGSVDDLLQRLKVPAIRSVLEYLKYATEPVQSYNPN